MELLRNLTLSVSGTYHDYGKRVRRSLDDSSLRDKGFYNGTLLGCRSYRRAGSTLLLDCVKVKFFDFLASARVNGNPLILTANALIVSGDRVLIMKRSSGVYGYKQYWDVPACLVLANRGCYERLTERIADETTISARLIRGKDTPFAFVVEKPFLHLYYRFSMRGSDVSRVLASTSAPNKLAMLRRDSFRAFCNTHKCFLPAKSIIESHVTRKA